MLGNAGVRRELEKNQVAPLHLAKKEIRSERKVTCLRPTGGKNGTRKHFVAPSSTSVLLVVLLFFPEMTPSPSSCGLFDLQGHLSWLPYLTTTLPSSSISAFPIPLLWFVFLLLLYHHLTHSYVILIHYLRPPAHPQQNINLSALCRILCI